jgi:sugar lactone lactonase YvrE
MGKQNLPHPLRTRIVPFRIALPLLLFVLSLSSLPAQTTSVSALTIPLVLPSAIVFDSAGNLYVAETGNHVVRKVDTNGNLTTIAGTGTQGFSGDTGPATSATLDSPQGLALDPANNLYIADTHNHRIRRLDLTTGLITTIAGSTSGFSGDGAPALSAQLNLPTALAFDASGSLYFADTANHRIRRIDASTGLITTIAGTGTQGYSGDGAAALSAAIDSPTGIAIDPSGNLYLADTHNHRIRKITSSTGLISTIAGTGVPGFSGDSAPASAATLALPHASPPTPRATSTSPTLPTTASAASTPPPASSPPSSATAHRPSPATTASPQPPLSTAQPQHPSLQPAASRSQTPAISASVRSRPSPQAAPSPPSRDSVQLHLQHSPSPHPPPSPTVRASSQPTSPPVQPQAVSPFSRPPPQPQRH